MRILDWWGTANKLLLCHGAAIAISGSAALMVGAGGAGKSTLALGSLGTQFRYLADDYVLVGTKWAPTAYSIFCSGKLSHDDLARGQPACTTLMDGSSRRDDKAVLLIDETALQEEAPIRAIVAPVIGTNDSPYLEPISPARALRSILPNTLQQLRGSEANKLSIIAGVVRAVPCFNLHLSPSTLLNLAALLKLLAPKWNAQAEKDNATR